MSGHVKINRIFCVMVDEVAVNSIKTEASVVDESLRVIVQDGPVKNSSWRLKSSAPLHILHV